MSGFLSVSTGIAFFDEGGVAAVVASILKALNGTLDAMGGSVIEMLTKALTTFAPILMTMSIVWLAINLYQRFTSRAGR